MVCLIVAGLGALAVPAAVAGAEQFVITLSDEPAIFVR
jgi:hypothetical protein